LIVEELAMTTRLWVPVAVGFCCAMLTFARPARADADSAKKYLQDARTAADNNDLKTADTNLQLAEAELDGVDAATKSSIAADIATLRKKMTDAQTTGRAEEIKKDIDSRMDTAKQSLDSDGFADAEKDISEFLNQSDVKSALGADGVAKYRKQLATFHKVWANKMAAQNLERINRELDSAEKDWPDKLKDIHGDSPESRNMAIDSMQRDLETIGKIAKALPEGNADADAAMARYKKLDEAVNAEALKAKAGDVYDQVKRSWESYADEYDGWQKETTGPHFEELTHRQSDEMSKLMAPKTVALVTRVNAWLDMNLADPTASQLASSDAKVKGYVDQIRGMQKTAFDKLSEFASSVLDEAEKAQIDKDARDRLETFANDDLRIALEGSDLLKPLQQRALKLVGAFDQKTIGDQAAQEKLYNTLVEQANKAWPAMVKEANPTEGFDAVATSQNIDPAKGKTIRLKGVQNRMGFDYSPSGGYDFAITMDGVPVAGKFSPSVRKAYNGISAKTGRDFSSEDCDVVATIEGMGPIIRIARAEGSLQTTGGEKVASITAQGNETVPGIRLKIIALHIGPVAANEGGAIDENGKLAP
jgi:hypothetical protein